LRGDLDNIVLMALRKEAQRRYSSVAQFSEDIARYLASRPVTARRDTPTYRTKKFVRRNKLAVAAGALVLLAIISGLIIAMKEASVARRQRDIARQQQAKAERIAEFLTTALSYSNPLLMASEKNRRDATINEMLDEVAPRLETELKDDPDIKASLEGTVGAAYFAQSRLTDAERYLNASLQDQLRLSGRDTVQVANTVAGLAKIAAFKGEREKAEQLLGRAFGIYRRNHLSAANTVGYLNSLDLYGGLLWTRGDYNGADQVYKEALNTAPASIDPVIIANLKNGLGLVRYGQGRLDEAAQLMREALATYRKYPKLRVGLASMINPLAQVLTWQGQYDEALRLLHESSAIALELLGENSWQYSRSLYLEAYADCLKGDYSSCRTVLDKLDLLRQRDIPDDKISKANVYDLRCMLLSRTGHSQEAEGFGRRATELYLTYQAKGGNSVTLARMHWAEALSAQRKYDQAEPILLAAYTDASEAQGREHYRTRQAGAALAALYDALGKPDLAERYRR
jgi:serine/threonine-protein kinase